MTPEQIALLESAAKIPGWGYAVIGVSLLIALLVGLDKAGYYLKRKRTAHFENGDTVKKDDLVVAFEAALKRHQTNGGENFTPGHAQPCIDHTKQLAEMGVTIPRIESDVKASFVKIKSVDQKVDRNLQSVTTLITGFKDEIKTEIKKIVPVE